MGYEQKQSKAMFVSDQGNILAKRASSKCKSLHKIVYVDTWLLGSPFPLYISKRGILKFCRIGVLKMENEGLACMNLILNWLERGTGTLDLEI